MSLLDFIGILLILFSLYLLYDFLSIYGNARHLIKKYRLIRATNNLVRLRHEGKLTLNSPEFQFMHLLDLSKNDLLEIDPTDCIAVLKHHQTRPNIQKVCSSLRSEFPKRDLAAQEALHLFCLTLRRDILRRDPFRNLIAWGLLNSETFESLARRIYKLIFVKVFQTTLSSVAMYENYIDIASITQASPIRKRTPPAIKKKCRQKAA